MKTFLIPLVLAFASASASAAAGPGKSPAGAKLAQDKQCMQCHSIDKDTIGPSFKKIKAIYRKVKNPESKLIDVMRLGSDAHLGPMSGTARMPDASERPPISDREAKQLARWILS
ncbi:c-type cytochrome [Caenimonas sp. SL110]|uniref:c-type cytochrome n=1 Tax=Caenimonas sp. SL110 TaxID=1450524 RepID=UPI000653A6B1|nr:c-type cytochrome [Caenimonas sp. SL110]